MVARLKSGDHGLFLRLAGGPGSSVKSFEASTVILPPFVRDHGDTLQEWLGAECVDLRRFAIIPNPKHPMASVEGSGMGAMREKFPNPLERCTERWVSPMLFVIARLTLGFPETVEPSNL